MSEQRDTAILDDYADQVLQVVEAIPPGRVMSYGDIAEYLAAGGPRQVGRVLATYGGSVAWWRVIHADGTPAPGHDLAALEHYRAEGTPLRSADLPVRVNMRAARWPGPDAPPGEHGPRLPSQLTARAGRRPLHWPRLLQARKNRRLKAAQER